jgi:hypothetical protein
VPAGCPKTGGSSGSGADADASSGSGADADACTEYAPRARLSRRGRRSYSRSRHGRRNTSQHAVLFKCAVSVPAARLRLHAASSSTRRTCATSTTTHCSRCARVRSPRCLDMLCRSVMVQHGMLQLGATAPHSNATWRSLQPPNRVSSALRSATLLQRGAPCCNAVQLRCAAAGDAARRRDHRHALVYVLVVPIHGRRR